MARIPSKRYWKSRANKAAERLADLYQQAGAADDYLLAVDSGVLDVLHDAGVVIEKLITIMESK